MKYMRRIKQYQPDILINNRMNGTRDGRNKEDLADDLKGDFPTPECKLGPFNDKTPWESCMTVADIPGTRGGPYVEQPWGGNCYKTDRRGNKTIYLHVSPLIAKNGQGPKGSEPLFIKDIGATFAKASVIVAGSHNGKAARLEKEDGRYKMTLPAGMTRDWLDTVIKLQ